MNNAVKGACFKLLNLNFFCLLSLVLHKIGGALPTPLIFCILNILGLIFFLPFVATKLSRNWLKANMKSFALRGFLNNIGLYTWLLAMKYLGPNEATAISFAIPVITLLLSAIFCGDRISSGVIFSIMLCVTGGYVTVAPKLNMEFTTIGVMFAFISSCSWAGYDITCKLQSKTENVISQSFKNYLYSGFLSVFFLVFYVEELQNIAIFDAISSNFNMILLAAVISALNIAVLFLAYSSTRVSFLMPISYLRLFIMSIYSYFFFGHIIAVTTVAGGTIIFLGNMLNYMLNIRAEKKAVL